MESSVSCDSGAWVLVSVLSWSSLSLSRLLGPRLLLSWTPSSQKALWAWTVGCTRTAICHSGRCPRLAAPPPAASFLVEMHWRCGKQRPVPPSTAGEERGQAEWSAGLEWVLQLGVFSPTPWFPHCFWRNSELKGQMMLFINVQCPIALPNLDLTSRKIIHHGAWGMTVTKK